MLKLEAAGNRNDPRSNGKKEHGLNGVRFGVQIRSMNIHSSGTGSVAIGIGIGEFTKGVLVCDCV